MNLKDKTGIEVKVGDYVFGKGKYEPVQGFTIDKSPIVEVTEQNGKIYFGAIWSENFGSFSIVTKPQE